MKLYGHCSFFVSSFNISEKMFALSLSRNTNLIFLIFFGLRLQKEITVSLYTYDGNLNPVETKTIKKGGSEVFELNKDKVGIIYSYKGGLFSKTEYYSANIGKDLFVNIGKKPEGVGFGNVSKWTDPTKEKKVFSAGPIESKNTAETILKHNIERSQ